MRYFSSRVTEDMALELVVLRAVNEALAEAIVKLETKLKSVNEIKTDALKRCVELRRELDKR